MELEYHQNAGGPKETFVIGGNVHKVVVKDNGGFQSRNRSTIELIIGALHTYRDEIGDRPFKFAFFTGDNPEESPKVEKGTPLLAYSTTAKTPHIIPAPDFGFLSWPEVGVQSYDTLCQQMMAASQNPPEYNFVFWIGNAGTHKSRADMIKQYADHPSLSLNTMQWTTDDEKKTITASQYVSLPDHCRFKALLDIRGNGYSGRFKYLMWSGRPILYVRNDFEMFYTKHLIPNFHFVDVADLSVLGNRADFILASSNFYDLIAKESLAFAQKHLTRANAYRVYADIIINHCLL